MSELNLGKVVGTDAKINGQTAITLTGANGISVTTKGTTVTVDGKSIQENISNPNIAINSNFKINQRNLTSYSNNNYNGKYTLDCWKSNNMSVEVINEGLKLTGVMNGNYVKELCQIYEYNFADLAGKTITVSAVIDGKYVTATGTVPTEEPSGLLNIAYCKSADSTHQFGLSYSGNKYYYSRFVTSNEEPFNVSYCKIEIGSIATTYIPPLQSTELAKCQRYLQKLNSFSIFRAAYVLPNYIDFSIPTPVTMRPGSISIIGNLQIYPFPINTPLNDFNMAIQTYGQNQLRLRATKTAHGLTDAVLHSDDTGFVLLSAEL